MGFKCCGDKQIIPPFVIILLYYGAKVSFFREKNKKNAFSRACTIYYFIRYLFTSF